MLFLVELQANFPRKMFLFCFMFVIRCVLVFMRPPAPPDFGILYALILLCAPFFSVLGSRFSSPHYKLCDVYAPSLLSILELSWRPPRIDLSFFDSSLPSLISGICICKLLNWCYLPDCCGPQS